MPIYDDASNKFYLYYLKDIWNDNSNQRHPWYTLSTTDFSSYNEIPTEIISSSSAGCDQDFAIGSGSVFVKNNTYYGFYTGHNPNFPSNCVTTKEGIMLATSTNPEVGFTKNKSFTTIYALKACSLMSKIILETLMFLKMQVSTICLLVPEQMLVVFLKV